MSFGTTILKEKIGIASVQRDKIRVLSISGLNHHQTKNQKKEDA